MTTVAIIQARMGSTRLPGKVMLPLDGTHVLQHDIRRAQSAGGVDTIIVATTTRDPDRIIARYAEREGAEIYRGSETDVLGRMYEAATEFDVDTVVRLTGDNPLVPIPLIEAVVEAVEEGADYASNKLRQTFPLGMDADAFSYDALARAAAEASEPHQREHVTPYVREHPDQFSVTNVTAADTYREDETADLFYDNRQIRVTLDEPDDYELLRAVYDCVQYDEVIDARGAIRQIVRDDLAGLNRAVTEKSHHW